LKVYPKRNDLDALTAQTDFLAEWGDPDWTILDDRRGTLPEFPADALIGQVRDYIGRAQANWLKAHASPTGGRPSQRWWVNPALYGDAGTAGTAGSPASLPLSALSAALPEDGRRNQIIDPDGWSFHLDAKP